MTYNKILHDMISYGMNVDIMVDKQNDFDVSHSKGKISNRDRSPCPHMVASTMLLKRVLAV